MKATVVLLCCLCFVRESCCAPEDVELNRWQERVSEAKAGMSLVDAERLLPLYTPPDSGHDEFSGDFTFGEHRMRMRRAAPDIVVWIDHSVSPASHPLTGPVIVERRVIQAIPSGFVCEPFAAPVFTLRGTISRDVN